MVNDQEPRYRLVDVDGNVVGSVYNENGDTKIQDAVNNTDQLIFRQDGSVEAGTNIDGADNSLFGFSFVVVNGEAATLQIGERTSAQSSTADKAQIIFRTDLDPSELRVIFPNGTTETLATE